MQPVAESAEPVDSSGPTINRLAMVEGFVGYSVGTVIAEVDGLEQAGGMSCGMSGADFKWRPFCLITVSELDRIIHPVPVQ
jgi:hypothetical protein